jgi:transcriptional regulator with XRE-family HTH domain
MGVSLGEELRRLRKERGLTLEEAANEIGITLQYMSLLEKGQRKSVAFEIMVNIARFYGVPLDYFTAFFDDNHDAVKPLTEQEIQIWNQINQQVLDEIYYKNGNVIMDWFRSLYKNKL